MPSCDGRRELELTLELVQEHLGRRLRNIKELARKGQLGSIHGGCRRHPGHLRRSAAETQEDPGKMVQPAGTCQPCAETILQTPVKSLDQAIGLRVEGSSRSKAEVQGGGERGPDRGSKLGSTVRRDDRGDPKPRHPVVNQGLSTGGSCGGHHRNSFRPAGGTVHDGEKVGKPARGWKRTNQIHMDMREPPVWHSYRIWRRMGMAKNLRSLTALALLYPFRDITIHLTPDEAGGDKAARGSGTRVGNTMDGGENEGPMKHGNQRSQARSGYVTPQPKITHRNLYQSEGSGEEHLLNLRAEQLSDSHVAEVNSRNGGQRTRSGGGGGRGQRNRDQLVRASR